MPQGAVTVTTSATKIVSANANRQSLIIANNDTTLSVFIGTSTVTAATGIPIPPGGNLTEDSGGTRMFMGDIYGITSSSTVDVRWWERIK